MDDTVQENQLNDKQTNWLRDIKYRYFTQPKQEWSEEDEVKINRIVACLENLNVADNDILLKDVDWLKSLKERIQPKAEWSEEDEQYLLVCKNALAKYQTTDKWDAYIISHWLENKLKSLRPQTTWKPSDEQMDELRKYSDNVVLRNLYYNLKKLKE
jgi:hypothetical protein